MKIILEVITTSLFDALIRNLCDVTVAISNLVMAVSAVVAIVHFKKHWRDDEPRAFLKVRQKAFKAGSKGRHVLFLQITVSNVGSVPFHAGKIVVADDSMKDLFIIMDILNLDVILDKGTSVTQYAAIHAKDDKITFPDKIPLSLLDTVEKEMCHLVINVDKTSTAGKAKDRMSVE